MPTQIQGTLGSPDDTGALVPLAGAKIYLSPSDPKQLRIQYGGAGEFVAVTANTALPALYQYGFVTQTDNAGAYDFLLPLDVEIHTPSPATFKWNLTLPDGSVYSGPPLTAAGPYSLDDLIQSHGWVLSSSLVVQVSVLGQVAQGTRTLTGQSTVTVAFLTPMPDASYQVFVSPGADSVTGIVPTYTVTNKSGSQFDINLSFPLTGDLDFLAWHP